MDFKLHSGEMHREIEKSAKNRDIAGLMSFAESIKKNGQNFIDKQEYLREKDEELFHENIDADANIVICTIFQTIVIIGVGIFQILALRKFFIAKNLY